MKYLLSTMIVFLFIKTEAQTIYNVIYSYDVTGNRTSRYKIITTQLNKYNASVSDTTTDTLSYTNKQIIQNKLLASSSKIKVYPNPVSTILNIDIDEPLLEGSITIVDAIGSVVYTKNTVEKKNHIDMSFLSYGLYLVKITINNRLETYSLLKQ